MLKSNKVKTDSRKIGRILSFTLLTLALLVGLIFSSVRVNMNMTYGSEYNGSYQASVQVIDKDNKSKLNLDKIASSLQDKLAPFSDKAINVSKQGKNHLNVLVGKEDYQNSENYLRSQIESNGGMFVLQASKDSNGNFGFQDLYTNSKVTKAVKNSDSADKLTTSDLFTGDVKSTTLPDNEGRKPFVEVGLTASSQDKSKSNLASALSALNDNGQNQNSTSSTASGLYFVNDLEELADSLRYLYLIKDNDEELISTYYNSIIVPLQQFVQKAQTSSNQDDQKAASVLKDFFGGTVTWKEAGFNVPKTTKISLLESASFVNASNGVRLPDDNGGKVYVKGINSYSNFKKIIPYFTANTSDRPTNYFLYNSDSSLKDIQTPIDNWLKPDSASLNITKQDAFKYITNNLIGTTLINSKTEDKILSGETVKDTNGKTISANGTPSLNEDLLSVAPQLKDYFLYRGVVDLSTKGQNNISGIVSTGTSFIVDQEIKGSSNATVNTGFYLRTANLTSAKKAVASIQQNGLGISYLVESITSVNPYITSVLYILSVVILSLIALLLAIYVLFVYRLLGLFTLLIAATSVAITLLAAVGFAIPMGPQVICALFVIIALILETNFILFEGFKRNFYKEKHGIISSFKIGNKETLSMAIDAVLVAFIPTIILFWDGSGAPKTFATLTIIGTGLAVVAGIIIGRFIYYFLLKSKIVEENQWLLPIDTDYMNIKTIRDEYLIKKYTNYLKQHEAKENYTSKELMKIKAYKEQLEARKLLHHSHLFELQQEIVKKDEKTLIRINKNTKFLEKFKAKWIKIFNIKHPVEHPTLRVVDSKIEDNNYLSNMESETIIETDSNSSLTSKLNDKGNVIRKNRLISKGTTLVVGIILLITIVAAIVGGLLGASWNLGNGYGQEFVIYGNVTNKIYDKVKANENNPNYSSDVKKEFKIIEEKYQADRDEASKASDHEAQIAATNKVNAYVVKDLLEYINENNIYSELGQKTYTKEINLKKNQFDVIDNYSHLGTDDQILNKDFVAIKISSTSTNEKSRSNYRRFLSFLAYGSWPSEAQPVPSPDNEGGLVAYDMSPYTISNQMKEIGIVFGITLAALLIYILIRFKWTYYVALALGLVLTLGITVACVVIFRVPVSTELLSGFVFVLTFAVTSMILVLGKGKSQLNLEEKNNIDKNFNGEIEIAAKIRHAKAKAKGVYLPIKKDIKNVKKDIHQLKREFKKTGEGLEEISKLKNQLKTLKQEYKNIKKTELEMSREFKDDSKITQNKEQRKNWFFKSLFSDLIDYSMWRMLTLGAFYLLVGIVLTVTLPSIFGMGLTIIIGLVAGAAVSLFIVVPVWIYFEKRRIRYVYGRKRYIESLKVSQEEEIVKGIND